ncbi:zinc finger protein 106 [Astyanax mexicanus]|uniref:Zinc finger protein 106 n=1 Tax=Astyanax mexicanus TaxID=7994 RepID=A0A8T2LCN2_ASTMX|nr:zinc finger protein 106 [Astyanax mexicanus]XP_049319970.1 zinc finger protein 106 [Astyanax mexicanus]KAG9268587.1 zinc finger protein 106 [Astyanax mexicanus]
MGPSSKMEKKRTCILCDSVYSSRQEMDEHMRSMLHHRELENLKGRDCGHECRVCGVTVASLTEYADHISSPVHKQRVEAHQRQTSMTDQDEVYFDKEMVELIEKRKEFIRQEEVATRRVRDEQVTIQKWQDLKEQWSGQSPWRHQQGGFRGRMQPNFPQSPRNRVDMNWQEPRRGPNPDCGNWNSWQNRSATWHAEGPPDLQRWGSINGRGGSLHNRGNLWGGRQGTYGGYPPHQRNQQPWPGQEVNQGNFERNNAFNWQRSKDFGGNMQPPHHGTHSKKQFYQKPINNFESQKKGHQNKKGSAGENDCGKDKGPKLDKTYRWAPYPPGKLGDPLPQNDAQCSSEKSHIECPEKGVGVDLNTSSQSLAAHSQTDLRSGPHGASKLQNESQQLQRQSTIPTKNTESNGKILTVSQASVRSSLSPRSERPTKHSEKGGSTNPGFETNLSPATSQDSVSSKASKHSHSSQKSDSQSQQDFSTSAEQERLLSKMLRKAKETLLVRRGSEEKSASEDCLETSLRIEEDLQVESSELNKSKVQGAGKKKIEKHSGRGKEIDRYKTRDSLRPAVAGQSGSSSNDASHSLQSLQVSTSTIEDEDECVERNCDVVQDQLMQAVDEGLGSDSEGARSGHTLQSAAGGSVPPLSKLALPACLKRDLNRHIGTKAKAVAHEPNLNIARRIRNLSGTRKSESEKDPGLKPTLRQLISSTANRRNVNWDQMYQEVHRKKQEQGKGQPRFGIEMVPNEPEGPSHMEEDDVPLSEGFQWDSLIEFDTTRVPSRTRSMSESNVVTDGTAASRSLLKVEEPEMEISDKHSRPSSKLTPQSIQSLLEEDCEAQGENEGLAQAKAQRATTSASVPILDPEPVDGDSSCMSGTELNDWQSGGKKRRAVGDVVSPEIPNSERKNKRLKIKPKKERSQLDELLAVSLREEELNSSLQAVDNSLIQARAALQAAYMEVQRLLMVKQQVTTEMGSLRTKRIEILQGLQGHSELPQTMRSCDENLSTTPTAPSSFSALPEHVAHNSSPAASSSLLIPSPTTSPAPVVIKQERVSPVALTQEREATDSPILGPHSTTPEQVPAAVTETGEERPVSLGIASQRSLMVKISRKDMERAEEEVGMYLNTASRKCRTTEESVLDPSCPPATANIPINPLFSKPAPASAVPEPKAGKRVRKLKKKKLLKKAQASEQPDISDSELDTDQPARPVRKLRSRRRPSGSSSSSSPRAAAEEKEENMEVSEAPDPPQTKEPTPTPAGKEAQDTDSSELEMVELPQAVPSEVVNLESSDPDEGVPEDVSPAQAAKKPVAQKRRAQKLACNEVTSTSEIDTSSAVKSSESGKKVMTASKASSDASSDPGEEELPTEGSFEGHQEAVNGMQIHNGLLFTCSGDRTVRAFSLVSRKCVAVFEGHSSKVNCLLVTSGPGLPQRLYSGSSDQTIRCYNIKSRECVQQLSLPDRVLCLHNRWKVLYAGLANGSVVTFSLKNNKQLDVFECHGPRAVSCLATAQEGARHVLLVGSYDSTISVRDAKSGLLLRTLEGHTKTVLCMKVVNDLVFSGSSDQSVHAHNIHTGELVRIYKGHSHAVTVVAILGKVMVTACLDKLVRVYELQSHDRLQVYGGHSDMVMCMIIHKSMIYTGCYNGSVQAVRLNLIQNYRCWWHGCSLIFGVMEHLQQHLLNDHTSPTQQTLKCRWRNCDAFFTSRNGSKQAMHGHMQKHAEEDSKMEP